MSKKIRFFFFRKSRNASTDTTYETLSLGNRRQLYVRGLICNRNVCCCKWTRVEHVLPTTTHGYLFSLIRQVDNITCWIIFVRILSAYYIKQKSERAFQLAISAMHAWWPRIYNIHEKTQTNKAKPRILQSQMFSILIWVSLK